MGINLDEFEESYEGTHNLQKCCDNSWKHREHYSLPFKGNAYFNIEFICKNDYQVWINMN